MTNEKDSSSPAEAPQSQPPQQPPVITSAPLKGALPNNGKRKTDDTKNEADELAREFRAAEKWVIGTNTVLAVIGIFALCIYYGQLKVMRGQLGEIIKQFPELQKSANAAKSAGETADSTLKDAEKHFRIEQRPYMIVRDPTINAIDEIVGGGNGLTIATIANIGKGVAFDEYGLPAVDIIDFDLGPKLPSETERNREIDAVFKRDVTDKIKEARLKNYQPPLRDIAPGVTATIGAAVPHRPVGWRQTIGIITGHSFIVFTGTIRYSSFGENHETEYCWFSTQPQKDEAAKQYKSTWVLCKDHNTLR